MPTYYVIIYEHKFDCIMRKLIFSVIIIRVGL